VNEFPGINPEALLHFYQSLLLFLGWVMGGLTLLAFLPACLFALVRACSWLDAERTIRPTSHGGLDALPPPDPHAGGRHSAPREI